MTTLEDKLVELCKHNYRIVTMMPYGVTPNAMHAMEEHVYVKRVQTIPMTGIIYNAYEITDEGREFYEKHQTARPVDE